MLTSEYPVVSSNLKATFGIYGTADPFDSTKPNNGARNPLGALAYFPPATTNGGNYPGLTSIALASTTAGYGSGLLCRYVLYKSTANPAMKSGPAIVYYTDETLTTVSGAFAEGVVASNATSAAGWLAVNTGTGVVGVGTAITATILNNGGNGSYVWIVIDGFLPQAFVSGAAVNNVLYGSGDFTPTGIADGSNLTHKPVAYVVGTAASNLADIIVNMSGLCF